MQQKIMFYFLAILFIHPFLQAFFMQYCSCVYNHLFFFNDHLFNNNGEYVIVIDHVYDRYEVTFNWQYFI